MQQDEAPRFRQSTTQDRENTAGGRDVKRLQAPGRAAHISGGSRIQGRWKIKFQIYLLVFSLSPF